MSNYKPWRKFPEYSGNVAPCASPYNTDFIIISRAIRPYCNTSAKWKILLILLTIVSKVNYSVSSRITSHTACCYYYYYYYYSHNHKHHIWFFWIHIATHLVLVVGVTAFKKSLRLCCFKIIEMKFDRNVLQVNMHRFMKLDFWQDITLSKCHFTQKSAAVC